jgi:CheY-like chemotaxis protein
MSALPAPSDADHATVLLDTEGRVTAWNAAAEEALGCRPDEMPRLPMGDEAGSGPWPYGTISALRDKQGRLRGYTWACRHRRCEAEQGDTPRRVLVVEDNHDSADSLAMLLKMWGHDVRVAHDGMRAIEVAREFIPEVVLLDIGLPGVSGHEVAVWLRDMPLLDKALLVAVTGNGQEEDRRRSRQAGCNAHLIKPANPIALHALLRQAESARRRPKCATG